MQKEFKFQQIHMLNLHFIQVKQMNHPMLYLPYFNVGIIITAQMSSKHA